MARHTMMLPDLVYGRELRTIVWDDEAGTVDGDHSAIEENIRPMLERPKPVTVGDPGGTWDLHDPAHDPAELLVVLARSVWYRVLQDPLRSTLPAVFDGVEIPPLNPDDTPRFEGQLVVN